MKRAVALIVLLGSLGILAKLTLKRPVASDQTAPPAHTPEATGSHSDPATELRRKYPGHEALVDRVFDRYRHNAIQIEKTDGLRGLTVLDRLDLEAVFLYEKYPVDFRRLCSLLGDDAAAQILLHWKDYLGLKHAEEADRRIFLAEIGRLNTPQRRAASRHPEILPFLLTDPAGTLEMVERYEDDPERLDQALAILSHVRLDQGPADLRTALRTLDEYGDLVLDSCRLIGLEGLALVSLYGPILQDLGDSVPLSHALIALRLNSAYVDESLRARSFQAIARELRHASAEGVLPRLASSPHGLQLVTEFGAEGVEALRMAGADAADLVYQDYADEELRRAAVLAMAEHGPAALAVLAKYADDNEFREILRKYGPQVVPPVIQADFGPEMLAHLQAKTDRGKLETLALGIAYLSRESGQGMIRTIHSDGMDRVRQLQSAEGVAFYELLPLYDILHLGNVVRRGYAPTKAELTWAVLDGCFVVMDALSLATLQAEGVAASELARSQLKTTMKEAAETLGQSVARGTSGIARRELSKQTVSSAGSSAEQAARWWLVRGAGGVFEVMRRFPEALARLPSPEVTRLGRPMCERAGIRLTTWTPLRFVQEGRIVSQPIPSTILLRRVAFEGGQAGVGWTALHKMEEHLSSRRPGSAPPELSDRF